MRRGGAAALAALTLEGGEVRDERIAGQQQAGEEQNPRANRWVCAAHRRISLGMQANGHPPGRR